MHPLTLPADWPHRDCSRRIACKPHLWHVQEMGEGPLILLLHGAGGSVHSWRHMMPLLVGYRVVAIDLPGQGFTRMGSRRRCGVDAMAEDVAALCGAEGWEPYAVIGHSAGGALALRLAEIMPVGRVIGINAALGNFDGAAGWLFPLMARVLAATPLVPQLFSRMSGTPERVEALLASTGSKVEPEGVVQYLRLLRSSGHVDATLLMMAQWSLERAAGAATGVARAGAADHRGCGCNRAAGGVRAGGGADTGGFVGRSAGSGASGAGRGCGGSGRGGAGVSGVVIADRPGGFTPPGPPVGYFCKEEGDQNESACFTFRTSGIDRLTSTCTKSSASCKKRTRLMDCFVDSLRHPRVDARGCQVHR